MNFYKRHIGDYSKDTPHLPMIDHGAYTLLLDYYYASERPLPDDLQAIYRLCRAMTKAEQQAVDRVIAQFFPVHPDGMRHNKRADMEIARKQDQVETNRQIGQRGGRPKKTEQKTDSVSETVIESDKKTEPINNPSHKPLAISQNKPPHSPPHADASGGPRPDDPAPGGKRKRTRSEVTTLPADWQPSEAAVEWTRAMLAERRLPSEWAAEQLDSMRDYSRQRPDWRHADWDATWRNWVRRELARAQPRLVTAAA